MTRSFRCYREKERERERRKKVCITTWRYLRRWEGSASLLSCNIRTLSASCDALAPPNIDEVVSSSPSSWKEPNFAYNSLKKIITFSRYSENDATILLQAHTRNEKNEKEEERMLILNETIVIKFNVNW